MHGIIGQLKSTVGNREKLTDVLLRGTRNMPASRLYATAADTSDDTAIWITEIWDTEKSHQASLQLSSVQKLCASDNLRCSLTLRTIAAPQNL